MILIKIICSYELIIIIHTRKTTGLSTSYIHVCIIASDILFILIGCGKIEYKNQTFERLTD